MIFEMTAFTLVHVALSLVGIASGFVLVYGFFAAKRLDIWTGIFLATTVLTSVTGFLFPIERFTPALAVGIVSLLVLAIAIVARYRFRLVGRWRATYVISSVIALYLNVFVLVVQLYQKVPALNAQAPTQSEPAFVVTQALVFVIFVVLAIGSTIRFRAPSMEIRAAPQSLGNAMRLLVVVCVAGLAGVPAPAQDANAPVAPAGRLPKGFIEKTAKVNGVGINYKVGGSGPVVVLLHGYAQTSHMWIPLMPALATSHTVIAPDLRGMGGSERTQGGYDKKTMAKDMRELVHHLGQKQPVVVVGHDIGLMVAYAYAAQYPAEVNKVVLMDAFLPGVGDWKNVWLMRDLWHFHFHGETALALVKDRERVYLEHFWNDFAADRTKSVPEADRQLYAAAYARDDGMRAGFEVFKNFEQDAKDFATFAATKLEMPFLVLTGEKASGQFLIDQTKLVATNVKGVIVIGSGHWLMEEAPGQVIPEIAAFVKHARGNLK